MQIRKKLTNFFQNKTGATLDSMSGSIMAFIMIGITAVIGLKILGGFMSNEQAGDNNAQVIEGINQTMNAVGTFPDWFGIIALVIVAVIIISLVQYLRNRE